MSIDSFKNVAALMGLEPGEDQLLEAASRFTQHQTTQPDRAVVESFREIATALDEVLPEAVLGPEPAGAVVGDFVEADAAKQESRRELREELIPEDDPMGLERIINASDLMPVNYLEKGLRVSQSVARIIIRNRHQQVLGFGTGFLVSPNLLMTNNHVLKDKDTATYCMFEFQAEYDIEGRPKVAVVFEPDVGRFFYTNKALDFTLIAVKPTSIDGKALSDFPFNRIIATSGKALPNEYVSIIQHPQGMPKQVTVRENRVLSFGGNDSTAANFIHYTTDTEPGSSGSPVFNDQWIVVALHHSGVPATDQNGRIKRDANNNVVWIGNEGVRVSSICAHLAENRSNIVNYSLIQEMLELGENSNLWSSTAVAVSTPSLPRPEETSTVEVLSETAYASANGYSPSFLGVDVPLPGLTERQIRNAAKLKDGSGHILNYTNFSLVMNAKRRIAYYSACNIDGGQYEKITRTKDVWYVDGRISENHQSADVHYRDGRLGVDRGHITRREEPNWGPQAETANRDTFHFTNCSPQFWQFNQQGWLTLEKYVLETAKKNGIRVTVFTGPVLRPDDRPYRGLLVPADFWKIVVWNSNGTLKAAAYLHSQRNFLDELAEAYGPYKTYQRTVAFVQDLTDLDFSHLVDFDVNKDEDAPESLEAARPSYKVVESEQDLQFLLN